MGKLETILVHPRLPFIVALLGVVLGLPFLGLGLVADDYLHRAAFIEPVGLEGLFGSPSTGMFRFADGDEARTGEMISRGLYPWYTLPELRLQFWRPLTVATHWIDYRLWPDAPWLMHLHSLLWFGASVCAVAFLYRRIMGAALAAGVAALLFAIDDTHSLPAGWIANRNSLVAVVFGVLALIHYDRWRREGQGWAGAVSVVLFAGSLLAKEGGIAVCAYLFAYSLFLDKGPWARRLGALIPYAVVVIVWRMYYESAGFGADGAAGYLDPLHNPGAFLRAVTIRGPLLLLSQFGFPPSEFYSFSPVPAQPFFVGGAVLFLAALLPFFVPLVRSDRVARFWALGMVLAVIPFCSTSPSDRLLVFPGIGAMGLLSRFFVAVRDGELNRSMGFQKRLLRPLYKLMMAIHFVLAPMLFVGMMFLFSVAGGMGLAVVDEAVPKDESVRDKTVILATTANYPSGLYLFLKRALRGDPLPRAVRSLSPHSMVVPIPLEVERAGESELRVRPRGGYDISIFRGVASLGVGDRVELDGLVVEIIETGPGGQPTQVAFHFDLPLEDPSYIWIALDGLDAAPWTLPAVGETVFLNWPD